MKRVLAGVLAAALCGLSLLMPAAAGTEPELEKLMADFRGKYGLTEENFSVSYYNTVSGESYAWNDERFMTAASTFKLPLNLYYYELEQAGKVGADTVIDGLPLSECHSQSLVWSNNDVSLAMLYRLGNFRTYKQLMRKYFTMSDGEIASCYYSDNKYCTRMMMDCLKYLYERREQFPEMLSLMGKAQPDSYFRRDVTEYPIAHKYGIYDGAVNDTGIINTPQPFLLAVYTQGVGEDVVAAACRVLTDYTVRRYRSDLKERLAANGANDTCRVLLPDGQAAETETAPAAPAAPAGTSAPAESSPERPVSPWLIVLIVSSVLLAADVAVFLILRRKDRVNVR